MHHQGSLTANKPLPRLRTLESPSEARTAAQGLTGVTLLAIATVALYVTVRGPIPTGPIPTKVGPFSVVSVTKHALLDLDADTGAS
jgi:hypothetical protein